MKKKLLSILLASSMAVSLAACGNTAAAPAGDAAAVEEAPAATEAAAEEAPAADDAGAETAEATGSSAPQWDAYDALIDEIKTTTDFAGRVDLMHQAEDMLMDTWAVIPIYYYNDVFMQKSDVTGTYANVYGFKYFQKAKKEGSDTLKINLASEPDYLDPALNSSVDGACLAIAAFSGILEYDENGKLQPAVAESMPEVSEDGTVYTVKLKETKWSNGDTLNANDFIYSWNRVIDENTAADYAYMFDPVARKDDGTLNVEATDDNTLVITLNGPCPYFNQLLAFPAYFPVHQASVEAADTETPGTWAQEAGFVCNGPYTLKEWSHDESMTYEKNENYYDAANVPTKTLQFMLSADDTAIYAAYNSGDLDFIDSVPNDEIPSLKDNPEFHIIDNMGTYYTAFNVNSDLFNGMTEQQAKDFRHAIALLIDRDYIVETVGQTGQKVADSYIPAGMSDGNGGIFKTDAISYYDADTTDVETAKSLLEGCGYSFTDNGDGTYQISPSVTIPYILNENSGHQKVAESIQSDLSVLGIEMTIETQDWNVFLENRKQGNYTYAREGWLADFDDPINMLEMFMTDSGNNDPQFGR